MCHRRDAYNACNFLLLAMKLVLATVHVIDS